MGVPLRASRRSALQALGRAGRRAQRVLDLLRLVDDDVAPVDLLEHLLVAPQERVARDDDVGVLELVLPLAGARRRARARDAATARSLSISRSQLVTTLVGATMSALKGLRLPSIFASSLFTASRSASVCTVLPRPMSSARTPPLPISWRNQSQ